MHQHTYPTCQHPTCTARTTQASEHRSRRTTTGAAHASAALAGLLEADVDMPCVGRHPADARPLGTPTWCAGCTDRIHRALLGPMSIADLLALAAGRRDGRLLEATASPGPRVSTTPVPPSPSPAHDEIDDIARWAADWATHLATYLGHTPTPDDALTATRLPDITAALGYLARWARPALAGPIAQEFGQAVLTVHQRLRRAAGEQDQRRRLRVACPACQTLALIREDGGIGTRRHPGDLEQVEVECTFCAAAWTEAGFQAALERAS